MATEGYTRKQMFLKKLNDSNFSTPVPVTVEEEIIDGGGSGSGGSNELVLHLGMTQDPTDGSYYYNLDKTFDEIVEAVKTGFIPVVYQVEQGDSGYDNKIFRFGNLHDSNTTEDTQRHITFVCYNATISTNVGEYLVYSGLEFMLVFPDNSIHYEYINVDPNYD